MRLNIIIISSILIVFGFVNYALKNKFDLKKYFINLLIEISFVAICVLSAFLMAKLEGAITNNNGLFSLFGIILISPIFVFVLCKIFKIDYKEFYEVHMITFILGLILLRINCIFNGCCLGKPNVSINGKYFVREVEIALNTIYLAFYFIFKNKIKKGMSYPIYMIFYGIVRFVIQFYRSYDGLWGTNIAFGHIWSIVSIVVGIITLVILHFRNKKIENACTTK